MRDQVRPGWVHVTVVDERPRRVVEGVEVLAGARHRHGKVHVNPSANKRRRQYSPEDPGVRAERPDASAHVATPEEAGGPAHPPDDGRPGGIAGTSNDRQTRGGQDTGTVSTRPLSSPSASVGPRPDQDQRRSSTK